MLAESADNVQNVHFRSLEGNILHVACVTGNLSLVKLLLSYNRLDITAKTIFYYYYFITFDFLFYLLCFFF